MSFNKHVFKKLPKASNDVDRNRGNVKHLKFTEDGENSVSLNNNTGMKRNLQKAQEGQETQGGGQDQMQQMVAQVQQMLQQASPEEVIAQLLQQIGDPNAVVQIMAAATQQAPEQIAPAVQQVAEQMQQGGGGQGQPQGAPEGEGAPQEQMMPEGGQVKPFFRRYGDKEWTDPANHPTDTNDGFLVGHRGRKEARGVARMVNRRIRNDEVSDDGLKYGEFSRVRGKDFRIDEEVPSFAGGGEHKMPDGSMMMGDTHDDYQKMHKKHLAQLRNGGTTKEEDLDMSSIEGYSASLKSALMKHLYSGYAVNQSKENFKSLEEKELGGVVLPEARDGYQMNKDGSQRHYYEGHGPGMNNDPYGYQRQKMSMNPLARMFGAFERTPGELQIQGDGDFANTNIKDFVGAIGTTHEITGIDPVYKENIFGKEKRHKAKNIIGQRYSTQRIGSGSPAFTPIGDGSANKEYQTEQDYISAMGYTPEQLANPAIQEEIAYQFPKTPTKIPISQQPEPSWLKADRDLIDAGISKKQAEAWGINPQDINPVDRTPSSIGSVDDKWETAKQQAGFGGVDDKDLTDAQMDAIDELYQYAYGGSYKKMRKAQDGMTVSQDNNINFNASEFAYGLEDTGYAVSSFLDKLNSFESNERMAERRSPDSIFGTKAPHSGDEGIYWENLQRQMGQDMGADVLPGTGTDVGSFSQGMDKTFNGSLFRQQTPYFAGGGDVGGNMGEGHLGDLTLNDDQIKKLKGLGYNLKRIR